MNAKLRALLPLLLEIVIPIGGYFLLHALGVDDFWALTIPGILTAVVALTNTVRRRTLDRIGLLVFLEIVLSAVLLLVTRDPKIILLKPSFFTGLAGLYLLYTCFAGRAFVFEVSKPIATRGDPERERAFEMAWQRSAPFRQEERRITAVWGILWLAEAATRAVVVLGSPVSEGVLTGQIPGIVAIAAGILFTRFRVPALRRHVAEQQERIRREAPTANPTNPARVRR